MRSVESLSGCDISWAAEVAFVRAASNCLTNPTCSVGIPFLVQLVAREAARYDKAHEVFRILKRDIERQSTAVTYAKQVNLPETQSLADTFHLIDCADLRVVFGGFRLVGFSAPEIVVHDHAIAELDEVHYREDLAVRTERTSSQGEHGPFTRCAERTVE